MSWANFSIALIYDTSNTNTPDTCSVILSASNITNAGNGDYLYIDDLGFDGYSTGINETELTHRVRIFPNPAADEIYVSMDRIDGETKLFIYTLNGVLVSAEVLKRNEQKINTGDLTNGCYFVLITDQQRVLNQKLIIQR